MVMIKLVIIKMNRNTANQFTYWGVRLYAFIIILARCCHNNVLSSKYDDIISHFNWNTVGLSIKDLCCPPSTSIRISTHHKTETGLNGCQNWLCKIFPNITIISWEENKRRSIFIESSTKMFHERAWQKNTSIIYCNTPWWLFDTSYILCHSSG